MLFFLAKIENKFAEPDVNVLTAQSSLSCSGYTASLAASSHHHQPPLHLAVAGKEWELAEANNFPLQNTFL
jgi:hypothetical protein